MFKWYRPRHSFKIQIFSLRGFPEAKAGISHFDGRKRLLGEHRERIAGGWGMDLIILPLPNSNVSYVFSILTSRRSVLFLVVMVSGQLKVCRKYLICGSYRRVIRSAPFSPEQPVA